MSTDGIGRTPAGITFVAPDEMAPPASVPDPAGIVVPDHQSRRSHRGGLVALIIGIVVIAMVAGVLHAYWGDIQVRWAHRPIKTSAGPSWLPPIQLALGEFHTVVPLSEDVVLIWTDSKYDGPSLARVDLSARTIDWDQPLDGYLIYLGGDTSGVVVHQDNEAMVLDAATGARTGNWEQSLWNPPYWVGDGLAITSQNFQICARSLADPILCLWTAPDYPISDDYITGASRVFGGGRWVNTNQGVRDLATGQSAPFGHDAGDADGSFVFYASRTAPRMKPSCNPRLSTSSR